MGRRKAPPKKKQTPSSKSSLSNEEQLNEAQEAFLHAKQLKHQIALKQIRDLCNNHTNSGILFGAQAHILDICYDNLVSDDKKKKYLDNALDCARKSIKLSPNSIVFSAFLGHLLLKSSNNAEDCMNAFEQFNTTLRISHPTDPSQESPHSRFSDINDVRKEILNHLDACVLKLKVLGVESSIILSKLQSLNVEKQDKVKLYWSSLSRNEKENFLMLDVGDLKSSLVSSKKDSSEKILSDALSFYEAHKKWAYWMCISCDESFPNSSLHFIHFVTIHLKDLLSELKKVYAVRISAWASFIKKIDWRPLDISAATTLLENKRELLSSNGKETNIQETSASEWDIYRWPWKVSSNSNCKGLLSTIQKSLKSLLLKGRLLATHMDILTQRAMSKFDGHFGGLLRKFRIDRTHFCLCFLDASQLKEIHKLLQEMSIFTASASLRENSGKRSIIKDDRWAFEINGKISLSPDSLHLLLDEDSLCNESMSGGSCKNYDYTNDSASATYDSPNVDNLITWIYSDHSSDQHLEKWRSLRAKKRDCGKEELDNYTNSLSESLTHLHEFQEGVSLAVIPTDVSDLEGCTDTGFALQTPQLDTSIQATIHKKSENTDSELSKSDEQVLQFAVVMHQLENILNCFAAYDYQPIVLSIVKQYIQEHLEGIIGKDPTKESDTSLGKDMRTEEMGHTLEMKESAGALIGKDLGTAEVRHPLEKKESIGNVGASIGEDLGTEEVRYPLEMKESIGNVEASVGKGLGAEEVKHPLEVKESIGASVGKGLGAEKVRLPNEMRESIVDPQLGYGNIQSTRQEALDGEGFDQADVEEALRLSLGDQGWQTVTGRARRRTTEHLIVLGERSWLIRLHNRRSMNRIEFLRL